MIQGSTRMVKEPGNSPGEDSGATGGLKVRRKEVSPLSDLMVRDMATRTQEASANRRGVGERHEESGQPAVSGRQRQASWCKVVDRSYRTPQPRYG